MRGRKQYHNRRLIRDLVLVVLSIILAIALAKSELIIKLSVVNVGPKFLTSFVSGTFFTSLFTTPISIVIFAEIAKTTNILYMAFWGALGAVLGDMIIMMIIKNTIVEDLAYIFQAPKYRKFFSIFRVGIFRWLTPFIGAMIIASPIPDEVGITLMGLSRVRSSILIPISFIMNFIGILLIGEIATLLFKI